MKRSNRGFTGIEEAVTLVVIAACVATFFGMQIHIPFVETKADVQKKLSAEEASHKITKTELASANQMTADQQQLLKDFKAGSQQQALLTQSAANALATITATFELQPAANRKELVINYASQTAAKALPAPSNYPDILKKTQDQLDESKTSNAQLLAQHSNDLTLIDTQKTALAAAQKAIALQQDKVDAQQAANDSQKIALEQQRKSIEVQSSALNGVLASLDHLKFGLMGLVGLAGVICGAAGYLMRNALLFAKGILLIILAGLGMIIPLLWYLIAIGATLLIAIAYVISQWHKEKTFADNAAGILGEVKQKAPAVWDETVKPIAKTYWGTAAKDVSKADRWVQKKLYDLNLLSKDQQP